MKNNFLKVCSIVFIFFSTVQAKAQVDPKYLSGAVEEKNGKVVFSDTIIVNNVSQQQIYEKLLSWAEANYNNKKNRVAYTNKENGIISCKGEEELIFTSSALSLDRTFMNYQLNIFCKNDSCQYELKSISYLYDVPGKNEPEKILAEDWITDKEAVNKDKLYRSNGKFRIKTIDLVDNIHNSMATTVFSGEIDLFAQNEKAKQYTRSDSSPQTNNYQANTEQKITETTTQVTKTEDQSTQISNVANQQQEEIQPADVLSDMASFKKLDAKKIPGNIIKMLSEDWMLITAGNESKFNAMTASWGGIGYLWEKPVVYCFINPARYTFHLMEKGDTYSISFYTEAYRDALKYCGTNTGKDTDKIKGSGLTPITLPSGSKAFNEAWMILECKKIAAQSISPEAVFDEKAKKDWGKTQYHKLYIGEILNVWVK